VGIAWITGNSATGKSAVCAVLSERGYFAVDADMGAAAWVHRTTGEVTNAADTGPLSQEWFRDHQWVLLRSRAETLIESAERRPAFLCGMAQNDEELWDLFDVAVCLTLDDATIRKRLAQRRGNQFGKAPAEIEAILAINGPLTAKYAAIGASLVDAAQPLELVVADVLRACASSGMDLDM
jgi:broad-specificity NMP kinase